MALPPLADVGDLAAWVGQEIPDGDLRAGAVLSAASALVRAHTGQTWMADNGVTLVDDVPDVASSVTVQVAARVWSNPMGVQMAQMDDGTLRWSDASSSGLYLSDADKEALGPLVADASRSTGVGTLGMTRGLLESDAIYVPTAPAPSGYPFPWYSSEDLP